MTAIRPPDTSIVAEQLTLIEAPAPAPSAETVVLGLCLEGLKDLGSLVRMLTGESAVVALMSGPCWFCRRPMNWFTADAECLPFCRWCLQYLREAAYWVPGYARLLCRQGNYHAQRRRDRQIDFVGVGQ